MRNFDEATLTASETLFVESFSDNVERMLGKHTMREWAYEAHEHGMKIGEYLDSKILSMITKRYNLGFYSSEDRDLLRWYMGV